MKRGKIDSERLNIALRSHGKPVEKSFPQVDKPFTNKGWGETVKVGSIDDE